MDRIWAMMAQSLDECLGQPFWLPVDRKNLAGTHVFCMRRSGRRMPEEKMAPADLAVP